MTTTIDIYSIALDHGYDEIDQDSAIEFRAYNEDGSEGLTCIEVDTDLYRARIVDHEGYPIEERGMGQGDTIISAVLDLLGD